MFEYDSALALVQSQVVKPVKFMRSLRSDILIFTILFRNGADLNTRLFITDIRTIVLINIIFKN